MTEPRPDRERDLDRFLTFVDAVVAIAITLLVLPLAEVAGDARNGHVANLLDEHKSDLLGFGLSFAVIAQLWFTQHHIVSGLVVQHRVVTRLMLAWTFTIVLLPFPTSLVARAGTDATTKLFYIGTLAVSSALLGAMAWVISRDRSIRDTDDAPDWIPSAGTMLGYAAALAITLTFPSAGYYPLLLLLLAGPSSHAVRQARGGRARTTPMGE